MTEKQLRQSVVNKAVSFLGCNRSNGTHKPIIDEYNTLKPLPRGYKVSYTDPYCATFISAIAVMLGLTDIILPECGCPDMILKYKNIGRWEESDAYVPNVADIVMYDWQDTGVGDNMGEADHVGFVCSVTNGVIKVIEGNKNGAVDYREIAVNGKFIRGYCLPDYASKSATNDHLICGVAATEIAKYVMAEFGAASGVNYNCLLGVAQCMLDMLEDGGFGSSLSSVLKYNFTKPADTYTLDCLQAVTDVFENGKKRFTDAKILQFRSFYGYGDGNGNPDQSKCAELLESYDYLGADSISKSLGHLYFGRKLQKKYRYAVQVGAKSKEDAEALKGALTGAGYKAVVVSKEVL